VPRTFRGLGTLGPYRDATIEHHLNGRVTLERALEEVVKVLPIGRNDDELSRSAGPVVQGSDSPDQLVERALASVVAKGLGAPQDFDSRDGGIIAQPLRDLSCVLRDDGRAPGVAGFETTHNKTPEAKVIPNQHYKWIKGFRGLTGDLTLLDRCVFDQIAHF
jgi:hypothetical protein